jgi:two-component system LytT family sensor kinase
MITLIKKPVDLKRIELWAAGLIYGFILLMLLARVAESNVNVIWTPYRYMFEEYHLHYSYSKYYFLPMVARYTLYFFSFLLWNFVIIPSLVEKRKTTLMIVLAVALFGAVWLFCGITDTWLKGYLFYKHTPDYVNNIIFKTNLIYALWVMMMLTLYSLIKHVANYLLNNTDRIESQYKVLTRDSIIALVVWMLLIFGLLLIDANIDVIALFFCDHTGSHRRVRAFYLQPYTRYPCP